MKVLVAGDGAVAAATVTALVEQGHEVRLLSPDAEATVRRWPHGVEASGRATSPPRGSDAGHGRRLPGRAPARRRPRAVGHDGADGRGHAGPAARAASTCAARAGWWPRPSARARSGSSCSRRCGTSAAAREDGARMREAEDAARGFRGVWSILRAGLVYAPGEGALASLATMVRTLPAIPLVDGGRPSCSRCGTRTSGARWRAPRTSPDGGRTRPARRRAGARCVCPRWSTRLSELVGRRPVRLSVPGALATAGRGSGGHARRVPSPRRAGDSGGAGRRVAASRLRSRTRSPASWA